MIFNNIKDENGTPLITFAKLLQEKASEAGLVTIMVFAAKDGPNQGIHVVSNIATSVPTALIALGEALMDENSNVTAEKVQNTPPIVN